MLEKARLAQVLCTHYMHKRLPLVLLTLELYFTVIYLTDFSSKIAILCPTARPNSLISASDQSTALTPPQPFIVPKETYLIQSLS